MPDYREATASQLNPNKRAFEPSMKEGLGPMRLAKAWCGCHIKIAGQRRADAKGKSKKCMEERATASELGPMPAYQQCGVATPKQKPPCRPDRALLELWICFGHRGHLRLPSPCADLASPSSWYCGVTAPRNYIICGIVLVCTNSVCLDVQLVYLEHAQVSQGGLNYLAIAGRGARPCQCIFST